jgi:hypothetical protein
MQTNELEMLSQRLKEAEERLRRVEEENEELSQGEPTPPTSPEKALPPRPSSRRSTMRENIYYDDNQNEARQ